MSSCKELLLDVMRLVQEVEKGLAGEEKRRRVLTLTMRVLEQLTEDSGEKQGESSKRKTTEQERKGKESGGQRQEAASTVRDGNDGGPTPTTNNKKPTLPEWYIHAAWAKATPTLKFSEAIDASKNNADGLVLISSKADYEALKQTRTKGDWTAISKSKLFKTTVPVALPVVKKCGTCVIRRVFVTPICGKDFTAAREDAIEPPQPDPVLFVQDWSKSAESTLTTKVRELIKKWELKTSPFGFKKCDMHTSMAIRVPNFRISEILEYNNSDTSSEKRDLFIRNPSWSNGQDSWNTVQFVKDLGFKAVLGKLSVLSAIKGSFYITKFRECFGLKVQPGFTQKVRESLGDSLKPALPTGQRFIIKSLAIKKFTTQQISDHLLHAYKWSHTIVASFHKGGNKTLIAISESVPSPSFVDMGKDAYLVINMETKREKPVKLGPTFNPGKGPVISGDLKRHCAEEPTDTTETTDVEMDNSN